MSETVNIGKISEDLSERLFKVFGWITHGPKNFNFQQDEDESAKRRKKYPCDIVFSFEDPFTPYRSFLLTDLKSYAKSSAEDAGKLKSAITGLGKSVVVANQSSQFQRYLPEEGAKLEGFLFIFNHDLDFDRDFGKMLQSCLPSPFELPSLSSFYIFGPPQIQFLLDTFNDLEKVFGEKKVFDKKFTFFYPNKGSAVPSKNEWHTATPQMLLSPFIPVVYEEEIEQERDGKIYVTSQKIVNLYYRGTGESFEEFCFVLEYLFDTKLIEDYTKVRIKMSQRHNEHEIHFENAKEVFGQHFYDREKPLKKLDRITLESIPEANYRFSDLSVGMDKRKEFANG